MTMQYRATVSAGAGMDFVISDGTMDRHGTRINPNGWDLRTFLTNPIALWSHGTDPVRGRVPIGRWENVRSESGKLLGKLVLAAKGTSQFVDELRELVDQGILRAVSVGFEDPRPGKPGSGWEIERAGLREISLVSVGSNVNALSMARGLNISESTIRTVFGEHANGDSRDVSTSGEHAETTTADEKRARVALPTLPKVNSMKTLSQRIEDAQARFAASQDAYDSHVEQPDYDLNVAETLRSEKNAANAFLNDLRAHEADIAARINGNNQQRDQPNPAINRRPLGFHQSEIKPYDLIVRSALCHLVAYSSGKSMETVLDERYPGHQPTAEYVRADATIATTTTSGWASQLVNSPLAELLELLSPFSVYPGLASRGIKVTFNNNQGAITIPSISTDAALAGGFVLEGDPIPVGRFTTASTTMAPHKFGIITTMSKEAAKYTTPALESVLRKSILRRTAITLDGLLLDATAGSTTRPAGLLNGVSALSAYGGNDFEAVIRDINTLMAPFDAANAGRSMVLIMNPAQARRLAMMPGPDGTFGWADRFMSQFTVLVSTSATAARLIAIDAEDFATATGDTPEFDVSEQATLHMSDAPAELVAANGTVADPTRSLFQTNSLALRMILPITWKMRRTGMVQYIDSVGW